VPHPQSSTPRTPDPSNHTYTPTMHSLVFLLFVCTVTATSISMSLSSGTSSPLVARATESLPDSVGVDGCGDCIQVTVGIINALLNFLLNGEIGGDCAEECGLLKEYDEYLLCDAVCEAVGIGALIEMLEHASETGEIDPIFLCTEVDMCAYNKDAAAAISGFSYVPNKAKVGSTIVGEALINVTNTVATGQLCIIFMENVKGATSFGDCQVVEDMKEEVYRLQYKVDTTPSEGENWSAGPYEGWVELCEGMCHGAYYTSKTLATATTNFTLTH